MKIYGQKTNIQINPLTDEVLLKDCDVFAFAGYASAKARKYGKKLLFKLQ